LNSVFEDLNNRLMLSGIYRFLLILIIVIPLIPMDAYSIYSGAIYNPLDWGVTPVNLIFAVFYYLIIYSINFILISIVWITLNLSWSLSKLANDNSLSKIEINIFHGFQFGFLNDMKDLIDKAIIYYFLCVSLAALTVVSPSRELSLPIIFYEMIFLLGIVSYLWGRLSIHKIFKRKWQTQIVEINDLYENTYYRLKNCLSEDSNDEEGWRTISFALDILQKQKDRLENIDKRWESLLNMIQILASLLASVATFWYKFNQPPMYPPP